MFSYINILFGDAEAVFFKSHIKLLGIDFTVSVVGVESGEGLGETTD